MRAGPKGVWKRILEELYRNRLVQRSDHPDDAPTDPLSLADREPRTGDVPLPPGSVRGLLLGDPPRDALPSSAEGRWDVAEEGEH